MRALRRFASAAITAACVIAAGACAEGGEAPGVEGIDDASTAPSREDAPVRPRDGGSSSDGATVDDAGATCTGKVVINELMTEGSVPTDEFVELYNPGGCAVSLGGWKIGYRSYAGTAGPPLHTFASGDTIPAKSFLLLGTTAFKGKKDVVMNGGMASDAGQIGLEDDKGSLVDAVAYGTADGAYKEKAAAQSPPPGGSIARRADGVDTDNNAADFVRSTPHSAGAPNP